jgi:hypothetical protein
MLFFGYFSCLILGFTALAMLVIGTFTNSTTLPKQHHPRPPIEQTITPEQIAPLYLEVTKEKEASAAKDDVSPVKHHKHKVLARQRNNYEGRGYGYARGYAQQETQYGPQRLFSNW